MAKAAMEPPETAANGKAETADTGVTFIAPAERAIYRDYERRRRLQLTGVIGAIFSVLVGASLIISALYFFLQRQPVSRGLVAHLGSEALAFALYLLSVWATRRQQAILAAATIVLGTLAVVVTFQVTWTHRQGLDSLAVSVFGAYLTTIALAGILGNARLLFPVTALTNALCVGICLALPQPSFSGSTGEVYVTLFSVVAQQWAVAVLIFAAANGYLRSLRELGDVRVAFERAKRLDELKDQFISSVNHELRNPIMALYNYVDIVRLTGAQMTEQKREALLTQATQVGDRVIHLLQSILDVRRLDQGAGDFTPTVVQVREAVETAAQLIDPREGNLVERELRLTIPEGTAIWGDAVRFQQIITNLLSNAIKYSAPGTPVEVIARRVEAERAPAHRWRGPARAQERQAPAPMVELTVRDYGLGIPPDQIPLLFNRFARLPRDMASKTVGNGLGLWLCQALTQAMHGRIWVESAGVEGEGATFHVLLPVPAAEPADEADAPFDPHPVAPSSRASAL